jgi:hypothetical protein
MFDISSGPKPPCPECSLSKTVDATDNEIFEATAAPQSSTTSLQRANITRGNPTCYVSVWFNVATALARELLDSNKKRNKKPNSNANVVPQFLSPPAPYDRSLLECRCASPPHSQRQPRSIKTFRRERILPPSCMSHNPNVTSFGITNTPLYDD